MMVAAPADPQRNGPDAAGPRQSRRAGPVQVVKAVLSAFIGIRRGAAHEDDAATITPLQAIITGIVAAAILVLSVLALVRFVMG